LRVVVLETVVAIDVTVPLREKIAQNGSELPIVDNRVEIWDSPSANSTYPIQGLVVSGLHNYLQNAPSIWDDSVFRIIYGASRGMSRRAIIPT
jgi:hypothetical protein